MVTHITFQHVLSQNQNLMRPAPRPQDVVRSPTDSNLDQLCEGLHHRAGGLNSPSDWPAEQLQACATAGVFSWFLPAEWGGQAWEEADILRGYLRLSQACLTTTFIITQLTGACRRIVASSNEPLKQRLLPALVAGDALATLGISHLTTSRQHVGQPVLLAKQEGHAFRLEGFSPWVTGAARADYVVTAAVLEDGRQIMVVVDTTDESVQVSEPASLVALSASQTGAVHFRGTHVLQDWVLAGPVENVMQQASTARTGGLQTSTLALGLASAALEFVADQIGNRPELAASQEQLQGQWQAARQLLFDLVAGHCENDQASELRARSNSLALRATQSALVAAKGAGFVSDHPAGRWCREALFFLVWSCPQPVLAANLCEFAGMQ